MPSCEVYRVASLVVHVLEVSALKWTFETYAMGEVQPDSYKSKLLPADVPKMSVEAFTDCSRYFDCMRHHLLPNPMQLGDCKSSLFWLVGSMHFWLGWVRSDLRGLIRRSGTLQMQVYKSSLGTISSEADAFVGIDVFGASAPGGTCSLVETQERSVSGTLHFAGLGLDKFGFNVDNVVSCAERCKVHGHLKSVYRRRESRRYFERPNSGGASQARRACCRGSQEKPK